MSIIQKNIIEARNVSFIYGAHNDALSDVSFSIKEGDYVGVVGPNGGGKTTLIKLLLGLLTPTTGTIELYGQSVMQARKKYSFGYIPQRVAERDENFPATVEETVLSGRTGRTGLFRSFTSADTKAVHEALELTGTYQHRLKLLHHLSGGERQRIFIARALAAKPSVLILDEPTVGVDVSAQEAFYQFLKKLNKEQHITIILVSHDLEVMSVEARTILCVNKTLVCRLYGHFNKKKYLHETYGSKVSLVNHVH